MPSSDPITIPKIIKLVTALNPQSILDVGSGNGRYGFLFRETLDMNHGRLKDWRVQIDAVEVELDYLSPVHNFIYNNVYLGDWLDVEIPKVYDLVFLGDVLEHFAEGDWQLALLKAKKQGRHVIVVCPNWDGSIRQAEWHGYQHEAHQVELDPVKVGGKCVFANSKSFISVFGEGVLTSRDVLLD